MLKLPCPSCGAEVIFQSSASIFSVCNFCKSMLVRRDKNLEDLGKMADLLPDISPLQISTEGKYQKVNFGIVGRQILGWENGRWNEWYIFFDDGRWGWLAEAQGFYMISFRETLPVNFSNHQEFPVGRNFQFKDMAFAVEDRHEAWILSAEGELPSLSPPDKKFESIDFKGPQSEFACLQFFDEGPELYLGEYLEFDDLHFNNLRKLEGW
ncbi:MAG: DUF4178 domain-containing protein [Deltaproteobacteria bacterium]|nr:DUF4178 domain-containing protein [Deltaproteobacteria bacterium]